MSFFVRIALVLAFAAGAGSVLADGEQQRVDDLEKRIREMEAKIAEQDRKSADASLKAREFNAKADESRRRASERSRVFDDARRRADRERRRVNGSDRTMNDAKRRIGDLEQKVSDRKAALKGIEDDRRRLVNDEQVNKLKRATQAQRDIQERIDMLRKILAADEPEIQKLVQPNRRENELVTTDTSAMKMVDAYEIAKQIEAAITESYKDVKATQTAIERKISFEAAQKLTDVAKPVRMDAKREVIEDNPRTKEALDAQKIAQTEVIRETDSMVETVVAMMEEAMEIVRPDDGSKMQQVENGYRKVIPWMSDKDFEKRKSEDEREKRLAQMAEIADFQVAISEAASENENERAKDLTKVMEDAVQGLLEMTQTCIVCDSFEDNMGRYLHTFFHLYQNDTEFRKKFDQPRRTEISQVVSHNYVVEEKIEDIYVLIDKFGYTKSCEASIIAKQGEEVIKDFPNTVKMKNTDKLCVFTAEGNMYQVKASTIPKGRPKDKGVLIHTLCKVGKEDIIAYMGFEDLFESQLLFVTKSGYIKLVQRCCRLYGSI